MTGMGCRQFLAAFAGTYGAVALTRMPRTWSREAGR
jgi:hypothetical protein